MTDQMKELIKQRGQSLVELAIFFPVLLIIVAGIVEISNILNTQNKITTAARMGAGFGANNVTDEDVDNWSNPSSRSYDMGRAAVNSITQTLEINPEHWSVFSIYAETNNDGSAFDVFTHTQVYGDNVVVGLAEWQDLVMNEISPEMLAEINSWPEGAGNLPVVASVAYHNVDAILGIPVTAWTGLSRISSMTVMRLAEQENFAGCPILPITVRLDQFSSFPYGWIPEEYGWYPSGIVTDTESIAASIYPEEVSPQTRWDYPDDEPSYVLGEIFTDTVPMTFEITGTNGFPLNVPGIPLEYAIHNIADPDITQRRLLYLARETGPSGSFGWLDWTAQSGSEPDLATSLTWPGDFTATYPIGLANDPDYIIGDPPYDHPACYNRATGEETCDGVLQIGEFVRTSTGNINARNVREQLQCYVDLGASAPPNFRGECVDTPKVVLLVYRTTVNDRHGNPAGGWNGWYQVAEFIEAKLIGYKFGNTDDDRWLLFEYLGVADECYSASR